MRTQRITEQCSLDERRFPTTAAVVELHRRATSPRALRFAAYAITVAARRVGVHVGDVAWWAGIS